MIKPIIKNNEIDFKGVLTFFIFFHRKIIKISFFFVLLYLVYYFIKPIKYNSFASFYTDYQAENNLLSVPTFLDSNNDILNFSVKDYMSSDDFMEFILTQKYNVGDNQITLVELWGTQYNNFLSLSLFKKISTNLSFTSAATENDKKLHFSKMMLKNNLKFNEDRVTGLNTINCVIRNNPDLSLQIIKNSFNAIVSFYNELNQLKAKEKRLFIEQRVFDTSVSLKNAENNLKVFLENNSNISSPMLQLEKERLEREVFLYSQIYLNLFNQFETSKIDENDSTSSIFLLDKPQILPTKHGMSIFRGIVIVFVLSFMMASVYFSIRNRKELFNS